MKVPQKLKIDLPQDPATSFLGIHQKDARSYYRDTCSSKLLAALFTTPEGETSLDVYKLMDG